MKLRDRRAAAPDDLPPAADPATKQHRTAIRGWSKEQSRIGRRRAWPVILLGVLSAALGIAQNWCVAVVLAHALARAVTAGAVRVSMAPLAGYAGLAVARVLVGYAQDRQASALGATGRSRLRRMALRSVLADGPALLRRHGSGALAALLVDRIDALDGFFARWLPAATLAILCPALVLAVVLVVQPRAALVLLCCGLAVPVFQAVFGIGAHIASKQQFTAMARLQGRFLDRTRGIATLVIAGQAEAEAQRLHRAADELRRRTMRVLRVAFLSSAALDCAFAVALVLIALLDSRTLLAGGAAHSWIGALLLPRSLFALLLVPEFFAPLRTFALAYQDRMQVAGAAEALLDLPQDEVAARPMLPDALHEAAALHPTAATGIPVAFEYVSFAWDAARGPVLSHVSFAVAAGEAVVLSGPSGSGKSTVIEMLLGFCRPDAGRILVDGIDQAALAPDQRARAMSWIGQRPLIFAASIRDNILFARPDATDEELARAVHAARVDAFAPLLPRGLDTLVGEGGFGLSGGQAQRLAIARAFLRDAPLLLLDEPTSHLDPDTEREVFEALRRLAAGRTVILAGHSAATLGFAERRIELENGRVVSAAMEGILS